MIRTQKGFSLTELMVTIAVIAIISMVTVTASRNMTTEARLRNQVRWMKNAVAEARAESLEYTTPVRVTFNPGTMELFAERDENRSTNFSASIPVLTDDGKKGIKSPYKNLKAGSLTDVTPLTHWSGSTLAPTISAFPDNSFVILPDGSVNAGNPLNHRGGVFYFSTEQDTRHGALYISPLGEMKIAYYDKAEKSWTWME